MVADGGAGGGGGGVVGGGVFSCRQSNGAIRQQSVEDDLWGWFGDDRPPPETTLHETPWGGGNGVGAGAGTGAGVGAGVWPRESTEVTVSTLALSERLAKLSAGRVLLDRVRADTRSLASVVSSAARSALSGLGSGGGGGNDRWPDGATAAPPPAVGAGVSSPTSTRRAVQFSEGSPPGGRSPRRARPAAENDSEPTPAAEAGENGDGESRATAATGEEGDGRAGALRRRVVGARAELEGLQKEIRRLVREGGGGDAGLREEARARVAPLVERRAMLAKAARADAERMAERLQEISEAQQVGLCGVGIGWVVGCCVGFRMVLKSTSRSARKTNSLGQRDVGFDVGECILRTPPNGVEGCGCWCFWATCCRHLKFAASSDTRYFFPSASRQPTRSTTTEKCRLIYVPAT